MTRTAPHPERVPWRVRERHERDIADALNKTGVVVNWRVMRFNGGAFHKMFRGMGHTASEVERCACYLKRPTDSEDAA